MPIVSNRTILLVGGLIVVAAAIAVVLLGRSEMSPGPTTDSHDRRIAEPDAPAVLTARVPAEKGPATLTLDVTGYTPPNAGNVQAVVKVKAPASDALRDVGRFTMFPNEPFSSPDADGAMRFTFPIDESTISAAQDGRIEISVVLEPIGGDPMTGARLEFSQASFEPS